MRKLLHFFASNRNKIFIALSLFIVGLVFLALRGQKPESESSTIASPTQPGSSFFANATPTLSPIPSPTPTRVKTISPLPTSGQATKTPTTAPTSGSTNPTQTSTPTTTPVASSQTSLYLLPSSATTATGGSFSLAVRLNASESVNAVQANLSYDTNMLEVASISDTGSAFAIKAEESYGGGSIRMARGTMSPVSGDVLVATINFVTKTNTGSTIVSFDSSSSASSSSSNTNILGSTAYATVFIQ